MADPRPTSSSLPPTPGERLVRRTSWGLALFTLTLIAILLGAVGVITALAVVQMTDLSVDQNLHAASESMLNVLEPKPTPTPSPTPEVTPAPEPTDRPPASPDENSTDEPSTQRPGETDEPGDAGNGRIVPAVIAASTVVQALAVALPSSAPGSPEATPSAAVTPTVEEQPPGSSDTFFLVLDTAGTMRPLPASPGSSVSPGR